MAQPLMPKATAVWLIDNTTLTFKQIAEFVGLHPLEISGIADGEVAVGIKGVDPIANNQLTRDAIEASEKDPSKPLKILAQRKLPEPKKKAPRYTPLSKRQERPAAIAWLVRNHPEIPDSQISKLLGTTKQTIAAIRDKTHWNSINIQPVDPVALGLCTQIALDAMVAAAAEKKAKEQAAAAAAAGESLKPTEETLAADELQAEPTETEKLDDAAAAMEAALGLDAEQSEEPAQEEVQPANPEDFFNLPKSE